MQNITGYEIQAKIAETRGTTVFRAQRSDNEHSVILKILKTISPSPSDIARFKQEYERIKGIDIDGVIKTHDVIMTDDADVVLVQEDFDGDSLTAVLNEHRPFGLAQFLNMAIPLAKILGELHRKNIIHRAIKPDTIFFNFHRNQIKIGDFGISTILTNENSDIYHPEVIKGTLAYISPEQTGRMNRTVDYRTDLYSLGVTFYEMITGRIVFMAEDPLEIIHSHIAREPVPPIEMRSDIPEIVSDIIMKLMAKNAEDRYQNAFGLMADLKQSLQRLEATGRIGLFDLGRQDISNHFILPKRLYGREKELDLLLSAFERMNGERLADGKGEGTVEVVLVTGSAGVGKSSLINEIRKPIGAFHGYFLTGKYEQFRKDQPYSAIALAFQGLIKQILSENDERIACLKERLMDALGPNARIIIDIIPEVELVIGPQPDVPTLAPKETRNRFNLTFERFVDVFAKKESPILLFLDDLQWADSASLQLIGNLVTSHRIGYLFFVASYREKEASVNYPLLDTLAVISGAGYNVQHISLTELGLPDIQQLVVDFFKCLPEEALPLAELTYKKTNGNAFFVNEFLHVLYDEKLIEVDANSGWKWDIERIRKTRVTDNVVELMANKISRLSPEVQDILKICACAGNRFELETISLLLFKPIEDVLSVLNDAIDEDFIHMLEDVYTFQHDRIQEAAYSLIPETEKAFLHHQIGHLLLIQADTEGRRHVSLFKIVDHLNLGVDCIENANERDVLARMNLECGIRAKESSAYVPALGYIDTGISLLSEECWEEAYELTLALYKERIEVSLLIGDFDKMNQLTETAIRHARSVLDKANVYKTEVSALIAQENISGALSTGTHFAELIGIKTTGTKSELLTRYMKFRIAFWCKKDRDILNLPDMTDPVKLTAMEFGKHLGYALYNIAPQILASGMFKNVTDSVKYGLAPEHANNYCGLGIALISGFGDIDAGYRFGKLGMQLSERPSARKLRAAVIYVYNTQIRHWKEHYRNTIEPYLEGCRIGLETGDLLFAADNLNMHDMHCFYLGYELSRLALTVEKNCERIKTIHQMPVYSKQLMLLQCILNLQGKNDDPMLLIGSAFDERTAMAPLIESNNRTFLATFHLLKLYLALSFWDTEKSFKELANFKKYMDSVAATLGPQQFPMLEALILLNEYRKSQDPVEKIKYLAASLKNLKKIKKYARHAPMNHLHSLYLIKAELARNLNCHSRAKKLYELAMTAVKRNGYTLHEMLISEIAVKYYLELDKEGMAMTYMINTVRCCQKWGATAKLKQLRELYPDLIAHSMPAASASAYPQDFTTATSASVSRTIDLASILKASQVISGEVALGSLLKKMMDIAIENAGARRTMVILNDNGKLFVEAECSMDGWETKVLESIPVDVHAGVPAAIVNHTMRTRETLIVNNAAEEGNFIHDAYVVQHKSKSIMCTPIINQGRLNGLLYLENDIVSGAFTQERVTLLNALSSQIAISIDNAKLYMNLEEKVKQRTEALDISNKELTKAKDALWEEMELAQKIQTVLLPQQPKIANYEITGYMKPSDEIGGDYYDIITIGGRDWIVIGDVSGHGVSAGLIMMMVQTAIHSTLSVQPDLSPSELLTAVNAVICGNISKMGEEKCMTIMVIACQADGRLCFSGLHQNILIYRQSAGVIETVMTEGVWLGLTKDISKMLIEDSVVMHPGDTMLLYTNGIIEANPKENPAISAKESKQMMFGEKRLLEVFKQLAECGSVDGIKQGLLNEMKDYVTSDDVTFVVVRHTKLGPQYS